MEDFNKYGEAWAKQMRVMDTPKAHRFLAAVISRAEHEAVKAHQEKLRELLGIPEGVPCCGDK